MLSPAEDALEKVFSQAARLFAGGVRGTAEQFSVTSHMLHAIWDYGNTVSIGLFPVAVALLIFHENYQASLGDGRPFRIGWVLGRVLTFAALIHPWTYSQVCTLITYAAGAHDGWMSYNALVDAGQNSFTGLTNAFTRLAGDDPGISDYAEAFVKTLPIFGVWLLLVSALVLAYVAGLLLGLSQAVILSILLSVGKTCLVVSVVPGIGLWRGWALSLAKTAAWSTIGGLVASLMLHALPDLNAMVTQGDYGLMLRTIGQFAVLAICTFSVPSITERIFNGAAPAGNAALEGIGAGIGLAFGASRALGGLGRPYGKLAGRTRDAKPASGAQAGGQGGGDDRGGGGSPGDFRPHKIAPSRLRDGLAAAGAVAAAPIALAAARLFGREPSPNLDRVRSLSDMKRDAANRRRAQRGKHPVLSNESPGQRRAFSMYRPGASPGAEPDNKPREEFGRIQDQLQAVRGGGGARPELLDGGALDHVSKAGISFRDWKTLRSAYPDLKFNPEKLKPVEKRILGVLDHYSARYAGWRDGSQGRADFAEARELATYQLQARRAPPAARTAATSAPAQARVAADPPSLAAGSRTMASGSGQMRPASADDSEAPPRSVRS